MSTGSGSKGLVSIALLISGIPLAVSLTIAGLSAEGWLYADVNIRCTMGKLYDSIDAGLRSFIEAQRVFFVASAPSSGGHVNLSPKGLDTLRIIDSRTIVYLDYVGSGAETIAHLRDNGRIVLMLCAFDGSPKIVRLHGRGDAIEPHACRVRRRCVRCFARDIQARAVIRVHVERISDSCGYGVPLYRIPGRTAASCQAWAERKGEDGLIEYQTEDTTARASMGSPPSTGRSRTCGPKPEARSLEPLATNHCLFDFGGVLVEFAGPTELGQHLRWPSTPRLILERWMRCPHTDEFERGQADAGAVGRTFIRTGTSTPPGDFWRSSRRGRGACCRAQELLKSCDPLSAGALSNSNELHWERNTNELRIIELFEFAISSHQVGLCKPIRDLRSPSSAPSLLAEAIVFFDDLANVERQSPACARTSARRDQCGAIVEVL